MSHRTRISRRKHRNKIILLLKEEFIGRSVEIIDSTCKSYIGICGKVIDETRNTFLIESKRGLKRIPKKGNVFKFNFGFTTAIINGEDILARPEDRIKRWLNVKKYRNRRRSSKEEV